MGDEKDDLDRVVILESPEGLGVMCTLCITHMQLQGPVHHSFLNCAHPSDLCITVD